MNIGKKAHLESQAKPFYTVVVHNKSVASPNVEIEIDLNQPHKIGNIFRVREDPG